MTPPEPETPAPRRARAAVAGPPPFELLVERHGAALLRFCVARLGPERGQDACQEALLSALRHLPELRDPDAAGGWLFSIARRTVVDAARADRRGGVADERVEELAGPWHDPEPGDRTIWAQVARLPPKQREAIGLRYLGELSHAEIAHVTGTSVEAARRSVFEGLRRLRREGAGDGTTARG